jgi:hypothetical protein
MDIIAGFGCGLLTDATLDMKSYTTDLVASSTGAELTE